MRRPLAQGCNATRIISRITRIILLIILVILLIILVILLIILVAYHPWGRAPGALARPGCSDESGGSG